MFQQHLHRVLCGLVALGLLLPAMLVADDGAKNWIRYPAISPDGKSVAFSFQGDIWVANTADGQARMVTSHSGYERSPVWSPDGKHLAFMGDWYGNGDVFLVNSSGGEPTRLTFHSASDVPTDFSNDGKSILFSSSRLDAAQAITGRGMGELYSVRVEGGRPQQIMTTDALNAQYSPDGSKIIFHDYKGFEDNWRKHHTSSVTRDIWTYEPETKEYKKLTGFAGEDRTPVFSKDGKSIYYLSEQLEAQAVGEEGKNQPKPTEAELKSRVIPQLKSSFNVWRMDAADPAKQVQITKHETHPVRFLTISDNGTLCYGFNGEIWLRPAGDKSRRLEISIQPLTRSNEVVREPIRNGATEMAVSPNEEEIAFIVRGEVFVTNVEFGTTRRITDTPTQERSVTWGDDSRVLYYAGERNNSWNLYKSTITRDDELGFANATMVTESVVLETKDETFQPVCSPDGKKLAYLKNRTELMILDLETGKSSTLLPAKKNFSYSDGDIEYNWSKDSRWVVATYYGRESFIGEIGLINVPSGEVLNITESGYGESGPLFASNGNVVLYATDRYGERSHGSWGGESDVVGLYLTQDAFDKATLSKEELALKKKREEKSKKEKKSDEKKEEQKDKADGKKDDVEPIQFEKEDFELRRRRLTLHSSALGSFDLSPDGEFLLYTAQVDDKWGLWLTKIRDRSTSNILKMSAPGGAHFSKDGKSAFLMQGGGRFSKVDLGGALNGGKAAAKPIGYSAVMNLNESGERKYIFEHAWRQVEHKFYDKDLHGLDWKGLKQNYEQFLPSINNNYDFAELLGELLGELNASHTGCRYRPQSNGDSTAALGLFYDVDHAGAGMKVVEVIDRGPCDTADSEIEAGVLITHINGERLTPDVNPYRLLNNQIGKPVRLSLTHDDKEWEETIRPISLGAESNLLYQRWITTRRELCDKLSGGKIGYVHVRGMNDSSFRHVYSEVLGRHNEKEALIVDTRFNGGGWLHEDLTTFLDGEPYVRFSPRGHEDGGLGSEPINKWTKPVVVLQSESNYSDAHFFPWAFKEKGVGKLVGSAVPGTATAVWWENQINPAIVFGIPQVGMLTKEGKYLENNQLEPDVKVLNDPPAMATGNDAQLKAAIELLLKK